MPSAITTAKKHRRSRRLSGEDRPMAHQIPIGIVSATKTGSTMTVVFNQAVSLTGIPAYTTNLSGITVEDASLTNPTTLSLTFSAAITSATTLNIPFEDPAIRNTSGGFVSPSTFPVT